jgi:hypothetical protein
MTHHIVTLDIAERRIEITSPAVGVSTLYFEGTDESWCLRLNSHELRGNPSGL